MFSKLLKPRATESLGTALNTPPNPGDFELGSQASRAAARALLEAKRNSRENVFRCVVGSVAGTNGNYENLGNGNHGDVGVGNNQNLRVGAKPRGAISKRSLCDDGLVMEMIDLTNSELSEKEAGQLIPRVPIDSQNYRLEDFRDRNAKPLPIEPPQAARTTEVREERARNNSGDATLED